MVHTASYLSFEIAKQDNGTDKRMKVLELFSGTEFLSDAFRSRGHECYTVDWDKQFPSSLHIDIRLLTADYIREHFGQPDVIWAGFDCTTFSVASIGFHRNKNEETGELEPKTESAAMADEVNKHSLELMRELDPKLWFLENPMGGSESKVTCRGCRVI